MPIGWNPAKRTRRAVRATESEPAPRTPGTALPTDPLLRLTRLGLAVAPAAAPRDGSCTCDRIGCPTPGAHPLSRAWQSEASADETQLTLWRHRHPEANYITPTGRTHDVLDVPADAGDQALRAILGAGTALGPVAEAAGRYLFFTAPRTDPDADADADEWWSSELDCRPETLDEHPGLRWHDRGSYVLVPPSTAFAGGTVRWVYWPTEGTPLPDALAVLEFLADVLSPAVGAGESVEVR